jgi:hydrogenase expression/formation protein HypC
MCLAIPGQVVEQVDDRAQVAMVDIAGVRRVVNVALLDDERLQAGDWVLIHVGFAMSKIDEAEAARTLELLQLMGEAYTDEVRAASESGSA